MNNSNQVLDLSPKTEKLNSLIVDAIQDIKGKKIVQLDLRNTGEAPTDFFIICEGDSITQVKAISNSIEKKVKTELGLWPNHVEGMSNAQWILVDYFDTVVHVFYPETRKYYDIEELWSDADSIEFEDL